MADDFTILAGTVGNGLWRSPDGGETWGWGRGSLTFLDVRVYGLAVHPLDPSVVYVGTDTGLHRSTDRGEVFELVDGPLAGIDVWRIAFDPVDPETIFVGTRPGQILRTRDAGKSWEVLPADIAATGAPAGRTRLTGLQVDPDDRNQVWGCIEVDGVRRSRDGGATWTHELLGFTRDFHWLSILPGSPKRIFMTTPGYVLRSDDGGESFQQFDVPTPYPSPYFREMFVKPGDPDVLLLGVGEHVFGAQGAVLRSTDRGETWSSVPMPNPPNSPIWGFGSHHSNPERVVTNSHYGELYVSEDAGASWRKLDRELTDVRVVTWLPN
ncbi:MAG TPA: hypothetical protein VGH94_06165 [Acidimicrobiales bacterium]